MWPVEGISVKSHNTYAHCVQPVVCTIPSFNLAVSPPNYCESVYQSSLWTSATLSPSHAFLVIWHTFLVRWHAFLVRWHVFLVRWQNLMILFYYHTIMCTLLIKKVISIMHIRMSSANSSAVSPSPSKEEQPKCHVSGHMTAIGHLQVAYSGPCPPDQS